MVAYLIFIPGRLNQAEYSSRIDPILSSPNGEKEHLHNQLIAAIYGNVTREMPDQGLAPWVSANDKPAVGQGTKPTTGDAAERRLKGEVMQLLSRDRRRIKDLVNNDVCPHQTPRPLPFPATNLEQFDPHESLAGVFSETYKRPSKVAEVPQSAAGINNMSECHQRYPSFLRPQWRNLTLFQMLISKYENDLHYP